MEKGIVFYQSNPVYFTRGEEKLYLFYALTNGAVIVQNAGYIVIFYPSKYFYEIVPINTYGVFYL